MYIILTVIGKFQGLVRASFLTETGRLHAN